MIADAHITIQPAMSCASVCAINSAYNPNQAKTVNKLRVKVFIVFKLWGRSPVNTTCYL